MTQSYRCICCGEEKDSDHACTCPNCGYAMFPVPYDRAGVLREQIIKFASKLTFPPVTVEDLSFSREEGEKRVSKKVDDGRFPAYNTIYDYACSATKLEEYIQRLHRILRQIAEYSTTVYQQTYDVHFAKLIGKLNLWNKQFRAVAQELELPDEIQQPEFPETKLLYTETPNDQMQPLQIQLLDLLTALVEKIQKFIRSNNIYGANIYGAAKRTSEMEKEKSYTLDDVQRELDKITDILGKRYVLDIFDDGRRELEQMSEAFWGGIRALLWSDMLVQDWEFRASDQPFSMGDLRHIIWKCYDISRERIMSPCFLAEYSEAELFTLYDRLLVLDSLGLMGVDRRKLAKPGTAERQLQAMIGLQSIKLSVSKIKAYTSANKGKAGLNIHMCFYGNPGTGKTEVARIIAGILHENKILPTANVVEVDRGGLVGQYVGETAQKTKNVIQSAMGGVLFVDEAYALTSNTAAGDYGHEAIATLLKAMEDHRGKFCVILAGYKEKMQTMLSSNPGFRSRIQFELDFPNYSREELSQIADKMAVASGYSLNQKARERILDVADVRRKEPNFANAREIRNILDQATMCHELRTSDDADKEIGLTDVERYIRDAKIYLPSEGEAHTRRVLTAEEELEQLIGLDGIKKTVRKIRAYAKRNRSNEGLNLHMCFCGNPGTGKTEVARLMSVLLHDAGVLPEAKMIETDASGLLGSVVGETAPKVHQKVQDALGGVLFIDEAYALTNTRTLGGAAMNYGDEAIATLLKEMEDRRGQFCVIFAGYSREMQQMLASNPGLSSRVQFTLSFPDYDRSELRDILLRFVSGQGYEIEDTAVEKLLDCVEYFNQFPHYANARTVRNILDQVILNQNLRTEETGENLIILEDIEEYASEEAIPLHTK